MKFSRGLKIAVCLVVAFSLVSMPAQEGGAVIGAAAVGLSLLAAFMTGIIVQKYVLSEEGDDSDVAYQTPTWKFMQQWDNTEENLNNYVNLSETHSYNMVEMLEGQGLYWQRIAERAITSAINHSSWDAYTRNVATEEFDFMIYNMTRDALLHPYTLYVTEMMVDANSMSDYDSVFPAPDCTAEFRAVTAMENLHNYTLAGVWHNGDRWVSREMNATVCFGPVTWNGQRFVTPGWEEPLPGQNHTTFARENYSESLDVGAWLQNDIRVVYRVDGGSGSIVTQENSLTRMELPRGGWEDCPTAYRSENFSVQFNNGSAVNTSSLVWGGEVLKWKPGLIGQYNRIRSNMLNAAYAWWSYLRSQGYTDPDDIPADMVPVYPDIIMDNFDALGGISREDAAAIYFSVMSQLEDQVLIQNGTLNADDFSIADYRGKMAQVTIRYHHDDVVETLVNDSRAYIIPYQRNLTLQANTTYIVDAATGNMTINQHIGVYTALNGRFYNLRPGNSYYELIVDSLYVDNETVDSITMTVEKVGDFLRAEWGFTLSGVQEPVFIESEDTPHLGIVIGGIVVGVICYVVGDGSEKHAWLKTVGKLAIAGALLYAGYVYIIQPLTSASLFGWRPFGGIF